MNLRTLKTKTIEDTDPDALDTAIAAFIATVPNATFVSIQFAAESGFFAAQIVYTS